MRLRIFCLFLSASLTLNAHAEATADNRINHILEEHSLNILLDDPEWQSYLGYNGKNDDWTHPTEAHFLHDLRCFLDTTDHLSKVDRAPSQAETRISLQLFRRQTEDALESYRWRYYEYKWNHLWGPQSEIPNVLTNIHEIHSLQDALDYIDRVRAVEPLIAEYIAFYREAAARGIHPPHLTYIKIIQTCKQVISGYPFDASEEANPIYLHFAESLLDLDISAERKESLKLQLRDALVFSFLPAYEQIIDLMTRESVDNPDDNGVWALPQGDEYYAYLLRRETTTELSPEEIHQIGLEEVARIHREMQTILQQVNFKGTLREFFTFLRTDEQFYFPDDSAGRELCLSAARNYVEAMQRKLPEMFLRLPQAKLEVLPVESYREQSAASAFYQSPASDGSRPGRLYINLSDMQAHPTYEMEALLYHEGIPGHHLQLSLARELDGLPLFRKLYRNNAYIEGWALYSEQLPKEFGAYTNPYSDFGRLNLELLRSIRLVVDTGLHYKRWTREQAIAYMVDNSPDSEDSCRRSIDRYLVMPAQATSYKIGMLRLLELRRKAESELGDRFDLRAFHDTLLAHGALPLDMLEALVDRWIAGVKASVAEQH